MQRWGVRGGPISACGSAGEPDAVTLPPIERLLSMPELPAAVSFHNECATDLDLVCTSESSVLPSLVRQCAVGHLCGGPGYGCHVVDARSWRFRVSTLFHGYRAAVPFFIFALPAEPLPTSSIVALSLSVPSSGREPAPVFLALGAWTGVIDSISSACLHFRSGRWDCLFRPGDGSDHSGYCRCRGATLRDHTRRCANEPRRNYWAGFGRSSAPR